MSITSTCLVEIDGKPLPADVAPLLISAYVDDSQRLPDMFSLRFRDPGRIVLAKTNAKIGAKVKVSVMAAGRPAPEPLIEGEITALEAEFDAGGTFTVIRGYDQAHRLFRGRRTASYMQMTASDIATKVAQRAGLKVGDGDRDHDGVPALSPGRADRLGPARPAGPRHRLRGRGPGRQVLLRPAGHGRPGARPRAAAPTPTRWCWSSGKDLLRFRSVLTSAPAGRQGRGPRLGRRDQAAADRDRAGRRPAAPSCRP